MKDNYPVIGMSPGNSYFKDEVINKLLEAVVSKYGRAAILIADIPAISTYVALGYPENRARRDKALPQGNNLRNKTLRARGALGYSEEQVKIIDWTNEVQSNDLYLKKFEEVSNLYKNNIEFQRAADAATAEVLEYADKGLNNKEGAVKIGVNYLLSELAFLEFFVELTNSKKVIYIYHKNWPVYEQYIKGDFDSRSREYLAFEIFEVE